MGIEKIGVVGGGQMGSGIAQVASQSGYHVKLIDVSDEVLKKALQNIESSCDRLIKKGLLTTDEKGSIISRIFTSKRLDDLVDCDLVIEAVTENIEIKEKIFRSLDEVTKKTCILASNTSSISITKLASFTKRPAQVVGMHFMNPVPLMKLVEGIRGLQTSDQTFENIAAIVKKMDKIFIPAIKDMPGFMVNRILMPMINEAIYALYEGIGTIEAIDEAMRLGANHPMGPLQLADFVGLDTCLAIMEVLHQGFADSKYRPCPLLIKYVEAGWLGRKSGRGFYQYS